MGNCKKANHVKFVRPIYLKRIKIISKTKKISLKEAVALDLKNFNDTIFEFFKSIKEKSV